MGRRGRLRQFTSACCRASDRLRVETQTLEAPHNAVKLDELSVFFGAKCLLSETTLKVAEHRRLIDTETPQGETATLKTGTCYGLVGVNGSGKSTLLMLLSERRLPIPSSWNTFLVSQKLPGPLTRTALEEVMIADATFEKLLAQQHELQEKVAVLANGCEDAFAELHTELLRIETELVAWEGIEQEAKKILVSLGFERRDVDERESFGPSCQTPLHKLSGGWQMKAQLAQALLLQPKLLLLDEPTNHLDFQALRWLAETLQRFPNTVVVVSHDVEFLHSICHEILWIRDAKIETLRRSTVSLKELAQMQRRRDLKLQFANPPSSAQDHYGCSFHDVQFQHITGEESNGWRLSVSNDIRLSNRSRCVLLGPNGSGKSTFLKLCAAMMEPTGGSIDRCDGCLVAYLSQFNDELESYSELAPAAFIASECSDMLESRLGSAHQSSTKSRVKKAVEYERRLGLARALLGNYGFDAEMADSTSILDLSGGQQTLLKLAKLSLQPAHLLFLDEPTNHLDAHARDALADALEKFEGGIVVATHDDLLIYRLIQCNWSDSEILLCIDGHVQKRALTGAHCMKTLKHELRKSETSQA